MLKEFVCSCVNPHFESLGVVDVNEFSDFIENAKSLSKRRFMQDCNLSKEEIRNIKLYPNDFDFFRNGKVYFYTHSRIEYFFK